MANVLHSASGLMTANPENPTKAFVAFLTVIEDKAIINLGRGDGECERWEITDQQLARIIMTGLTKILP